jgi:ParB/RepB/Spo0J family partition protein
MSFRWRADGGLIYDEAADCWRWHGAKAFPDLTCVRFGLECERRVSDLTTLTISSVSHETTIRDGEYFPALPIGLIVAWDKNPRKSFDPEALQELADSISADGVQQPIVVRLTERHCFESGASEARYQIIMGERRYRASKLAAKTTIPAIVRVDMDDRTALRLAVIENLRRADLDALETASGYQALLDQGYTQEEISADVGSSRPAIANSVRLLKLPVEVQEMVRRGELPPTHARHLLRFAEFPAVLIAMAQYAAARKAPASSLESGLPFEYELRSQGTIRPLWQASFDHKTCVDCPHKAYIAGPYNTHTGYCLLPAEFDAKQDLATQSQRQEQAKKLEAQVAKSTRLMERLETAGVDLKGLVGQPVAAKGHQDRTDETTAEKIAKQLPKLDNLKGAESLQYKTLPEACCDSCPCRILALDHQGAVVEACTDPNRLRALLSKETRGKKTIARQTLAEDLGAIQEVEALPTAERASYHHRTLAYLIWNKFLYGASTDAKRKAIRAWRDIDDPNIVTILTNPPYNLRTEGIDAVEVLARLSVSSILQLAMEVLAAEEAAKSIENANTSNATIDYLLGRQAASEATEEDADKAEADPEEVASPDPVEVNSEPTAADSKPISVWEDCDHCNGTGKSPTARYMSCGQCNGLGKVLEEGVCRSCGTDSAQDGKAFCANCDPDTILADLPELMVL